MDSGMSEEQLKTAYKAANKKYIIHDPKEPIGYTRTEIPRCKVVITPQVGHKTIDFSQVVKAHDEELREIYRKEDKETIINMLIEANKKIDMLTPIPNEY